MNRFFSPKVLVAATLATAALGAATVAEAHPDVYFSVGFQNGPAWVEPAPVYVQQRPVFVQPAPVYVRPPVFVEPHEVFEGARWGGYESRFVPALTLLPVIERVRDSLAKVYADKGLAITLDCAPALAWRIDEGDAFELLGNLMDNAVKWATQRVAVSARREGDRMHLVVDDDGPGFGDTRAILQLHVRGDERVPGHGVGLAVVDELVKSHGGELTLGRSEMGGGRVEIVLRAA